MTPSNPIVAPSVKICRNGLHHYDSLLKNCPECRTKYKREWHEKNREANKEKCKKYYMDHGDEQRSKAKQRREECGEQVRARDRGYYRANRDHYRKRANALREKNREAAVWRSMVSRCINPNDNQYPDYGGRGINVSRRWIGEGGFRRFLEDMGRRPTYHHSLDRRDNNRGYSKSNCRWITCKEQQRNKRSNVMVSYNGKTMCIAEWSESTGIPRPTLSYRLRKWGDVARALTQEVR